MRPPEGRAERTLASHGITKQQSSGWQKLAAILEPEFEAALANGAPTSASA